MTEKTWIVVANNMCARFFLIEKGFHLTEIETLVHPNGRLREQDFMADRPGRGHESMGHTRHAVEPKMTAKKQDSIEFAKHIAQHLETQRATGAFTKLHLAANATFLGLLRHELSKQTVPLVGKEVEKNIIHLTPNKISDYFRPA